MPQAKFTILPDEPNSRINPNLYGHFAEHLGSCVAGGLWVGPDSPIPNIGGIRSDVVAALRAINPPVLRWPGGCYADDYHWEDGIGPRASRPKRVNIWWGGTLEDNCFGTHEFIALCRLIGAAPYLAGNLGSGTVREMRDWVEYCNCAVPSDLARRRGENGSPAPFNVQYWGVGNEAWGCGGHFCPEDYAAEYRRYATYLRDFGDTPLYLIACGPDSNNHNWTRRFFTKLAGMDPRYHVRMHAFAAHYYCGTAGTATEYSTDQWYQLLHRAAQVETLITEQRALLDEFDPERKISLILDEWGTWHPPTPGRNPAHLWQQSTLRDALVAAITLDTLNRHADKVAMANIAQIANVLQSMVLTDGDRMLLTPTYHVFEMYKSHQGALSLRTEIESPMSTFLSPDDQRTLFPTLSGSTSLHSGQITLTLQNRSANLPLDIHIDLRAPVPKSVTARLLTADDITAHNTFDNPTHLTPRPYPVEFPHLSLPPASVLACTLRLA